MKTIIKYERSKKIKTRHLLFLNTKRFNHIANIEQTELNIEIEEDFDCYPLITYPETVTECLPISEDKSDMAVYVLKKGT